MKFSQQTADLFRGLLGICLLLPISFSVRGAPPDDSQDAVLSETQDERDLIQKVDQLLLDRKYEELEDLAQHFREEKSRTRMGRSCLVLFYQGLQQPSVPEEKYTVHLIDDRVQQLEAWTRKRPSSTATLALAAGVRQLAGTARGDGDFREIPEDSLRIMRASLDRAEDLLDSLKEEETQDAYRSLVEMRVGLLQGYERDQMESLLHEALASDPWWLDPIHLMTVYLAPNWYGGNRSIYELANRLAADQQNITGEFTYAAVVYSAFKIGEFREFHEDGFQWDRVRQGLLDWAKQLPDSYQVWGRMAFFARIAGDREAAQNAFEHLQGRCFLPGWKNSSTIYEQSLRWAFDDSGPGQSEVVIDLGVLEMNHLSLASEGDMVIPSCRGFELPIYSTRTGQRLDDRAMLPNSVHAIWSDAHSRMLLFSYYRQEGGLNVAELKADGTPVRLIGGFDHRSGSRTISDNRKIAAIGDHAGDVRIWTLNEAPVPSTISSGFPFVDAIAASPEGDIIAGACERTIKLWNVKTREPLRSWAVPSGIVRNLLWSPDGKILATSGEGEAVILWDPDTGQPIGKLEGHPDWLHEIAFSPDGRFMIVGTASSRKPVPPGDLLVFEIASRKLMKIYQGHRMNIRSVYVTPDQTRIVSGSDDASIRIWKMPAESGARNQE